MAKIKISGAYAPLPDGTLANRGEIVDVDAATAKRWREQGVAIDHDAELPTLGYAKTGAGFRVTEPG